MISAMRSMQLSQLRCAARGCGLRENMKACSACNVTRYCTVEHQKVSPLRYCEEGVGLVMRASWDE